MLDNIVKNSLQLKPNITNSSSTAGRPPAKKFSAKNDNVEIKIMLLSP
jgi:hypothetical protein